MNLIMECNFDQREYAVRTEIPIQSIPIHFFSTGRPSTNSMSNFVGPFWAQIIDNILMIEGVGAVEVCRSSLKVFKSHDLPWDHIDLAVQRLLP